VTFLLDTAADNSVVKFVRNACMPGEYFDEHGIVRRADDYG
jgi:hypothetical protein